MYQIKGCDFLRSKFLFSVEVLGRDPEKLTPVRYLGGLNFSHETNPRASASGLPSTTRTFIFLIKTNRKMKRSSSYSSQITENTTGTNSHELFSLQRIFSIKTLASSDLGHKQNHHSSLDPLGLSSAFKSILPASARDLMDGSFGGSSSSGSHGSSDHSAVSIVNVTHGGTLGNEFVAAYLSNSTRQKLFFLLSSLRDENLRMISDFLSQKTTSSFDMSVKVESQ